MKRVRVLSVVGITLACFWFAAALAIPIAWFWPVFASCGVGNAVAVASARRWPERFGFVAVLVTIANLVAAAFLAVFVTFVVILSGAHSVGPN